MVVHFPCKVEVLAHAGSLAVLFDEGDGLQRVAVAVGGIYLQGFLLGTLRGISPIALRRFLHTIDIRHLSPAYPHLFEVGTPLVVVQGIDGEYLSPLNVGQTHHGCYLVVAVFELGLVEQNLHVGVVDDGFLDNRGVNHVVQLLCHHSSNAVELAHRLVEVLDVLCHGGR